MATRHRQRYPQRSHRYPADGSGGPTGIAVIGHGDVRDLVERLLLTAMRSQGVDSQGYEREGAVTLASSGRCAGDRAAEQYFDRDRLAAAICAGGYRSSIATSILEWLGFGRIINVVGGMATWSDAKYEVAV